MVIVTTRCLTEAILCPATTGRTGTWFMVGWSSCFDSIRGAFSRDRRRAGVQAGAVQDHQRARHPLCRPGLRTCLRRTPGRSGGGRHSQSKHHLSGKCVRTYLFNLIRLARSRETFDVIYLDGSHSIYVDLAAAFAAVRLLSTRRPIPFRRREVLLRKETFGPVNGSICGCR